MLNKLIQMAKNGMFDTAFLLATKYNLESQLFNTLKGKHDITLDKLKDLVSLKEKYDIRYLDICYNLIEFKGIYSYFKELDFSNNVNLTYLNCSSNQINNLDISNNVNLTYLNCAYNRIEVLDTSNNINLTKLYGASNLINDLDVSNNVKLTVLNCSKTQIKYLDVSKNVNLTDLYCFFIKITNLDLSNNINLTNLYCSNNPNLKQVILNKLVKDKIEITKDDHTKVIYVD